MDGKKYLVIVERKFNWNNANMAKIAAGEKKWEKDKKTRRKMDEDFPIAINWAYVSVCHFNYKMWEKMCVQEKRANGWKFNWLESWFLVSFPSFPFFAFSCFHRWKKVKGEGRKSLSRINGWKYRKGDTRNRHLLLEIRQRISPDKMCFTFRFLSRVV